MKVYISIGSNLGEKIRNCKDSIYYISKLQETYVTQVSSFYKTSPVGPITEQPWFINCAIEIETSLPPYALLLNLLKIEKKLGRVRILDKGPRIIDLDILFYSDLIINEEKIIVPHPRLHLRKFVLIPLYEIAPTLIHPIFNFSIKQLLEKTEDTGEVIKIEDVK